MVEGAVSMSVSVLWDFSVQAETTWTEVGKVFLFVPVRRPWPGPGVLPPPAGGPSWERAKHRGASGCHASDSRAMRVAPASLGGCWRLASRLGGGGLADLAHSRPLLFPLPPLLPWTPSPHPARLQRGYAQGSLWPDTGHLGLQGTLCLTSVFPRQDSHSKGDCVFLARGKRFPPTPTSVKAGL